MNPAGGISNWMSNMCSVHDGHSVEMDWLRFYWDYRTNGPGFLQPSHNSIFEHIATTMDAHNWADSLTAYDRLLDAIQDPVLGQGLYQGRWSQLAITNGVAQ